jgi:hypothetical protein
MLRPYNRLPGGHSWLKLAPGGRKARPYNGQGKGGVVRRAGNGGGLVGAE